MKRKRAKFQPSADRHRLCFAILRLIRGKENAEVAAKANISPQTIRLWRAPIDQGGTLCPRVESLERVAKAYGMKLALVDVHESSRVSAHNGYEARA